VVVDEKKHVIFFGVVKIVVLMAGIFTVRKVEQSGSR